MPVITMTGTMGSGAREVGRRAATLLGIDFVDQQLMVQAARRCGVPVGVVAERDERTATFRERMSSAFATLLDRSAASAAADPLTGVTGLEAVLSQTYTDMAREEEKPFSDQTYVETMSAIMHELAASGRILILGRGSQMILKDEPRVLHVLCVAPRKLRYSRFAEREQLSNEDEARHQAEKSDKARAAFYQKLWKVDVEDPRLYDVTLDTSRMNFDDCAEVVALAARLKAGDPPS